DTAQAEQGAYTAANGLARNGGRKSIASTNSEQPTADSGVGERTLKGTKCAALEVSLLDRSGVGKQGQVLNWNRKEQHGEDEQHRTKPDHGTSQQAGVPFTPGNR